MDKNFYNEASAKKLGWEPSWFGERYFDDKLVRAIKKWQKVRSIPADGLCGPTTFRRLWTERQEPQVVGEYCKDLNLAYSNSIVYNGVYYPINWDKFVLWSDEGGMHTTPGKYYDYSGRPPRPIRYFVNHWDVCLSSKSCHDVLEKRGISVHFLIDNDGTIYQTMDMQHAAWHAGTERTNRASVGVEITNAYYPKYQGWYEKNGLGKRPIFSGGKCHGKSMEDFMDFYPVQVEALKALWKAVSYATDVTLTPPPVKWGYSTECRSGRYKGIMNHFNCSRKKIDCANLDIEQLLKDT